MTHAGLRAYSFSSSRTNEVNYDTVLLFQDEQARVGMTCAAGRVIVVGWSKGQCVVVGCWIIIYFDDV